MRSYYNEKKGENRSVRDERVSWSGQTDCCIKQTVQGEPQGEGEI